MHKFKYTLLCSLTLGGLATIFTSCDSGPDDSGDDIVDSTLLSRGYDVDEIANNPTAIANFPISVNPNDTIVFVDDGSAGIANDVPLQDFTAESSGILRSANSADTPINDDLFRWLWVSGGDQNATLDPSSFFGPASAVPAAVNFESNMQVLVDSGSGLGSLAYDVSQGTIITDTIEEGINASGVMCLPTKTVNGLFDPPFISHAALDLGGSNINLTVTSTNADLASPPYVLSGFYTQSFRWWPVIISTNTNVHDVPGINGHILSFNHLHTGTNVITYLPSFETRSGSFTMTLNELGVIDN